MHQFSITPSWFGMRAVYPTAVLGMRLHYEEFGDGRPLVILHGLLGSSDNWLSLGKRFGEGFHVVAMDLRNHGASPHAGSMSLPEMAGDVAETMDGLGLAGARVIGHSLGGKVAMELALDRSDLVERLVVVDIAAREYAPRHVGLLKILTGLDLGKFRSRTEVSAELEPLIPNLQFRQWLMKNIGSGAGGRLKWKPNLVAIQGSYPALTAAVEGGRSFAGSALLLSGGRSDYVEAGDLKAMRGLFPSLEWEVLAAAGHWLQAEQAEDFFRICSGFLAG